MKMLKFLVIALVLMAGLSSCLVVRDRPGYYSRPYYHHHHHYGHWYR
ncbi:hypothetical protein [Chitinophaga qingshengii]|uniref:Lipoprotein n=1 Tax=Chitinophaga qingshengii TaxID=1569794 RepID=A0ABR7TUL3_9BACT|nr:hypothetical protein [Chitinophaga qingshengii]MBC9934175.1 hypothetical protein [Chitinophaga qingshengii]